MIQFVENTLRSKIFWIAASFILVYLYLKKVIFTYWKRHGVPYENFVVPLGIFSSDFFLQKTTMGNLVRSSYERFKKYPFHGLYMFHQPVLMINDPELIKQVLVKDFTNFCNRGLYCNPSLDPLSGHLFFLCGDEWRTLRAKLSPTFTSGKLKHMFTLLNDTALEMVSVTNGNLLKSNIIGMKDLIARYAIDTVFSLAFGIASQSLKDPECKFRHYGKLTIEFNMLRGSLGLFAPEILYILRQTFSDRRVRTFFMRLFPDLVDKRRAEGIKRKDFLDSLIDLMDHGQVIYKETENTSKETIAKQCARRLDVNEAAAQAFVFFIAGFEISSSIAAHCLYELALNPEVQEKVHKEIDELKNNSKSLNYENLLQLEYLDMIFYETMRKHPPVPFLNRICINDYKIPNSDYTVPAGMRAIISVSGLHMDPDVFPNPQKFDPLRFSKENVASRHPCSYLAFGEGPRFCIAERLGILQTKMALFHLLSNFKFSVCEKTSIPNYYSPRAILQTPGDGINLRVEKRK